MRIYLDTNVIISLVRGEFGKGNEFMEEGVRRFLTICKEDEHVLIVSDYMKKELVRNEPHAKDWEHDFAEGIIVEHVAEKPCDVILARKLKKGIRTHFDDAFHMAIALRTNANLIVTWNLKDYENSPVKAVTPDFFS